MSDLNKKNTIWTGPYIIIFIVNLCQHMAQQTINTLIPKYAGNVMMASASVVGIISGIFAISAIAIRPFASPAFDCVKKKTLLIGSYAVILMAYVCFIVAPNVNWLIAGRLLQGVGIGCCAPLSLSVACDNLSEENFSKGVSFFTLGQAFGQALGPSIGFKLTTTIGYQKTFCACFAMLLLALILCFFTKCNPVPEGASYKIRLNTIIAKEALPSALTMTFMVMPYACISGFLAIYGSSMGIENVGLYFTVYAISILVLRFVTGGLADRFGFVKVLVPSMCCYAAAFLIFSLSRSMTGFIAAAVLNAFGYGIGLPNLQAMCMKTVPKERRGVGSNTFFLGQDIGQFIGPYIAGLFADSMLASGAAPTTAYSNMYRIMIVPVAVVIVMLLVINRKTNQKTE